MRNQCFATQCAVLVVLIQSAIAQQPTAVLASTNASITVSNSSTVQIEKNAAAVTTNAPPVVPPAPEQLTIDLDGVKMEFVQIHPGKFVMGSFKNYGVVHKVTLTKPYYIGKYEVTQEQWRAVMHDNPSHFIDLNRPVENVSWEDCQKFLAKLSEKAAGRQFSLPTEAQWEYACRAGNTGEYCFGDNETELGVYGWYLDNAKHTTHPVGEKWPNAWGLYDVHGNVWEWCADWYGDTVETEETDPTGPELGWARVLRGGSWYNYPSSCRSADRGFYPPSTRNNYCGLRVVTTEDGPEPQQR